ncbi:uncharacterized protein LOC126841965 [Adelges cooleyi]|uniref:uncharacterized protein LOC126841965 n=1 Tax=Adelges cooleyi TaxID=133065 RepID=UPI00217FA9D2|nr:uncharacterized protein LOC126841965 [Adelges cooleyi]
METFETIMSRNNTTTTAAVAQRRSGCSAEEQRDGGHTTAKTYVSSRPLRLTTAVSLVFFCLCLILSTTGASPVHSSIDKRSIASGSESTPKICHHNTPCGWAIYIPFTRRIDYFMKNTCDCDSTLACLKTDDDLSVNAYVYRCKIKLRTTTETPTTT